MKEAGLKLTVLLLLFVTIAFCQPCKVVQIGMTKAQVLNLVGQPTEIDTVISPSGADSGSVLCTIWQYGDVMKPGNQRVEFHGEIVGAEVISDGRKYDELLLSCERGEIPMRELRERIHRLNAENCK